MAASYCFSFEDGWRHAPLAFWVHIPVESGAGLFQPPAPKPIPHKGYPLLRIAFGRHELVFSSPAQLRHCIEILAMKPLPTTRQLSALRRMPVGPNGHWLSRLPAELKSPKRRFKLVEELIAVESAVTDGDDGWQFLIGRE